MAKPSDDQNTIQEVHITGFEPQSAWSERCVGWQFLQFKGCRVLKNMTAWQHHLNDICVAEKKNQLDRLGAASINKKFQECCHKNGAYSRNTEAPREVTSDIDYRNVPFVVWAKVIERSNSPAKHHPPKQEATVPPNTDRHHHYQSSASSAHVPIVVPPPWHPPICMPAAATQQWQAWQQAWQWHTCWTAATSNWAMMAGPPLHTPWHPPSSGQNRRADERSDHGSTSMKTWDQYSSPDP